MNLYRDGARTHPLEDILLQVRQPQQYTGCEWNTAIPDRSLPRITLVYPDTYELGMSNFGLAVVRHVLMQSGLFDVRRAFSPASDMDALLEERQMDWVDIEAGDPVRESRVIGFGIPAEALYSNYLNLLGRAGLPLRSADRAPSAPIVLAGGGGLSNPLPLSPFTDLFFLGEAEEQIVRLCSILCTCQSREKRLEETSTIPGVWVPSIGKYPVEIQRVSGLKREWAPVKQIVPLARISHDRAVVEVSRGCTRGCRFCQVSHLTRPVRERSAAESLDILDHTIRATGWEKAGLLSLSFSDHTEIEDLLEGTAELKNCLRVSIGQPSLRPDSLLNLPLDSVLSGRITLAPEAGSVALRSRINKPIPDDDIVASARKAFLQGAKGVKLYFMIGLPGETEEDLSGIGSLAARIASIARECGRRSRKDVTVALSPFVPKPHTPFQWAPMLPLQEMRRRLAFVRKRCGRVSVNWNDPGISLLEGVLGLGDDTVTADLLEEAVLSGASFDAWTDLFRWDIWQELLESRPYILEGLEKGLGPDTELPWSFVCTGIDPAWLRREWERACEGEPLPDCRDIGCSGCGACTGESVFREKSEPYSVTGCPGGDGPAQAILRVLFAREGLARFSSHLDTVRLWTRAVRRAGLPVCYSKGYVSRPKLHFGPPLPSGFESMAECVDVLLCTTPVSITRSGERIEASLPEGFRVVDAVLHPPDAPPPDFGVKKAAYRISGVTDPMKAASMIAGEPGVDRAEPAGESSVELLVELGKETRPDTLFKRFSLTYKVICRIGLYTDDLCDVAKKGCIRKSDSDQGEETS
jgi:radical SAM superfamily enzyme YgiQ (UPF0313 family)